ncbi:MAG TPA: hypothetical protein VLG40_00855 [Candidatus Saccharimonas sp.]|nr:hypothetical protein [Candidatus Saccharimonas sp.]
MAAKVDFDPDNWNDLLHSVASKAKDVLPSAYEAPKNVKQDTEKLQEQKGRHREKLLKLIGRLSLASFVLLTVVVILQMLVRIWNPQYMGISDGALNILAVSVFGEVITVVGTIVYQVWKDPK